MKALRAGLLLIALTAAHSAFAAEPPPAPPPIAAPPPVAVYREPVFYHWGGFYVGGHLGGARANKHWRDGRVGLELGSYGANGFMGGVQGGYNWQAAYWVFGLEVQSSWGKISDGVDWLDPIFDPASPRKHAATEVDNISTVAFRVGLAWDRLLFFGKFGPAWAYEVYRLSDATAGTGLLASATVTRGGWMWGVGFEYGFLGNWSAKIEFDWIGFGTERITVNGATTRSFQVTQDVALVKLGVNYRFSW